MRKKVAFVTGIGGQDGSYMAELLLEKGYEVHGLIRRSATPNTKNISHLIDKITLHKGDLSDFGSIVNVIQKIKPDIVFNLGAMSHVRISYEMPLYTADVTGLGIARILEACRLFAPEAKIYQASSSEMFGKVQEIPQKETTPFYPRSPYGCAKAFAFYFARSYREGYGMKVYNGILFNHESPRRGENFVTKKIVDGAIDIKLGKKKTLSLGNLDAKRDWGSSKDYMEAILEYVETQEPSDFLLATGETHSVEEFVKGVFDYLKLGDWRQYVVIDEGLKRPAEVDLLLGDAYKAKERIGFVPKMKFNEIIKWMCDDGLKEHEKR